MNSSEDHLIEDNSALMEELYGPLYKGDYQVGQTVRFYDNVTQREYTATIEWIQAPHVAKEGGRTHKATYIMSIHDPSTGWPFAVSQNHIIA